MTVVYSEMMKLQVEAVNSALPLIELLLDFRAPPCGGVAHAHITSSTAVSRYRLSMGRFPWPRGHTGLSRCSMMGADFPLAPG
jgi:hypothetical protein